MRIPILLITALLFSSIYASAQTHFSKFQKIKSVQVPLELGILQEDTTLSAGLNLANIPALKDFYIELKEIKGIDSANLFVYKKDSLIHQHSIPYYIRHLHDYAYIADIDNNKIPDIKLFIGNAGSGLASVMTTKIYLFNLGKEFKSISFFDFSGEDEYDLNNDNIYEIISKNHVYKNNHSYWAYNVYNFKNEKLINVSKKYQYPLWTKHLYRSSDVVAKEIPYADRLKEFRDQPDEIIIR